MVENTMNEKVETTTDGFVVSARKYRPATFRSVVGQGHITTTLSSAIVKGQLAHAYLFTGPRGVGKTTCARIFAKAINCTNPSTAGEACGECESCEAFDQGRSWAIHELDAASNNSVEDIRLLIEKVRIPPQVGKYSVYIIDEVHMLSSAAFNAFLKTLEEPPHYAVFILATTEKHKILPTILSRCQSYDFRRIGVSDIVEYLEYVAQSEGVKYDSESLNIIAQKADGGMRDALSTFDRVVSYSGNELSIEKTSQSVGALDYNIYFEAIELALDGNYTSLLLSYDQTLRSGFEGGMFLGGLAGHLRDLLMAHNPSTGTLLDVGESLKERYMAQAATLEVGWILTAMALINQADADYRGATNRRLHVELALMKLCGVKKKDSPLVIPDKVALPAVSLQGSVGTTPNQTTAPAVSVSTSNTQGQTTQESNSQGADSQQQAPSTQNIQPQNTQQLTPQPQNTAQTASPSPEPQAPTPQSENPQVRVSSPITTEPTQKATPPSRISITGISLSRAGANPTTNNEQHETPTQSSNPSIQNLPMEQVEEILREKFHLVSKWWSDNARPRIATALEMATFSSNLVTLEVANQTLVDLLNENLLEIQHSVAAQLGVRVKFDVKLSDKVIEHRPVSAEQKLEFLVKKNPAIGSLINSLALSE